jgi:hypothetical protein
VARIVVAYRPCNRRSKGLKTVYQQHLRYIQLRGLQTDPVSLFDRDLSKQTKEWRGAGKRIVLAIEEEQYIGNKILRLFMRVW